jgi:hypothetical protein
MKTIAKLTNRSNNTETKEIAVFEEGDVRGSNLSMAYKCLKTIPLKSVEFERGFSSSRNNATKLRSNHRDPGSEK